MKKERTKGFVAGCLVSLLAVGLGVTALSVASQPPSSSRTITVNELGLTVDGTKFVPRSSTGEPREIFSYEGTTYVPARAFAELIGLQVDYDASTQTAIVSTPADSGCVTSQHIGEARAKEIALYHAGVTEADVTHLSVGLDREDGVTVYDVEFYVAAREYEYEIDAISGAIYSYSQDEEDYPISTPSSSNPGTYIGEDKAKEIALQHAGIFAGDVTYLRIELERDDGRMIYDVEFFTTNREYDYEIDAISGTILSYDYDAEYTPSVTPAPTTPTGYITEDKAKEIALQHAGVSSRDVTFIQAVLERDDGRMIYDVEFFTTNREYDYEIDATSGTILSYDYDAEYTPSTSTPSGYISADKAKEIALQRAPGATVVKCELDYDDGRAKYEIELRQGRIEYECEIDATSGTVLKWESDYDD